MPDFPVDDRNRVRRVPDRGAYERETVYAILDASLIGHVGFVQGGQPYVIPTLIARQGDRLLLHGATTSRLMRHAAAGNPLCITITHVDGLVLARSVFHHSVNYRAAVVFGRGQAVENEVEKMSALAAFTERLVPGRWQDARLPNARELKATAVVAVTIESASAKIRSGPPKDDEADYELPVWAGVLPLRQVMDAPLPDARQPEGLPMPAYLQELLERQG